MKVKDLFTIQFKKPDLVGDEEDKEKRKQDLDSGFEKAYSRLESIEILNSNSKKEDVSILLNAFLVDIYNVVARYLDSSLLRSSSEVPEAVTKLSNPELQSIFQDRNRLLMIHEITKPTEEEMEYLEEEASKLLMNLEKYFKKIRKTQLYTSLDDYRKRWMIQGSVLVSVLILSIGSVVYNKIRYPAMHNGKAQVFFLTKESPNPIEEFSYSLPVSVADKGIWKDYRFEILGDPKDLIGVRIDPIDQKKIRFGISHVRYLDSNGKVLAERDFQLTESLLPKNIEQIGILNDLKPGRAIAGAYAEMVSTGNDPFFFLNLPVSRKVRYVEVRMRFTEEFNKFSD